MLYHIKKNYISLSTSWCHTTLEGTGTDIIQVCRQNINYKEKNITFSGQGKAGLNNYLTLWQNKPTENET